LEPINEYVKIDSVIRTLEELPIMKIHPRILTDLKTDEDVPHKLLDITDTIIEIRSECDKLAVLIHGEIENITNCLMEILSDLRTLLTMI
jgi:hypothetical protein